MGKTEVAINSSPETDENIEPAKEGESGSENDQADPIGSSEDIAEISTQNAPQTTISSELNNSN